MNKHTPGPWFYYKVSNQHFIMGDKGLHADKPIAILEHELREGTVRCNAAIIAAAPAMYEALQFTLAYFLRSRQSHAPEYDVIRAALAQAEGQQS